MEVNLELANLGNLLMFGAGIMYLFSLVFTGVDLIQMANRRGEARIEEATRERELVGAATQSGGATIAGLGATLKVSTHDRRFEGGTKREQRQLASVGLIFMAIGFAVHVASASLRGASVHRVPWGNMFEFSLTGSCVLVGLFLIINLFKDIRYLAPFVGASAFFTLLVGWLFFYVAPSGLVPSLQNTWWLRTHVSIAILSSGLLAVGGMVALMQILQHRREAKGDSPLTFLRAMPSAKALEGFAYRLHSIGFVTWTFTVVFGAIWAEKAWGTYWSWDPKEVWSFVIWVVYAAYLHARTTRGWRGERAAYFALAGFTCIILNFTVVNYVFSGMHSYAGG
ncbi:c-type cytochrome biogenesis protein CcsB [Micrococcales bacterium 31B]|nr:c-type cytochrome biogenesis protein CcsB [Micrococcales bacterium 31B]